jgi:hypothetical protein
VRRCDFCRSLTVRWIHPAECDWLACDKCHAAIQADDRQALLDRASQIPVLRTVPDRYAGKFLERAPRLHVDFGRRARVRPHPRKRTARSDP